MGYCSTTFKDETGLIENDLRMCFANSKFIVKDEMQEAEKLYYLKFDEFLEFVVRLAGVA